MKLYFLLGYFQKKLNFIQLIYSSVIESEQKIFKQINFFQVLTVFNKNEFLVLIDLFDRSNLMALFGLHDLIIFLNFIIFDYLNFFEKCLLCSYGHYFYSFYLKKVLELFYYYKNISN